MEEVKKQGTESLFVPYELALKLKELGFNQPCFGYYTGDKKHLQLRPNIGRINEPSDDVPTAPTFSQAFRFFREKYGIFSSIWIFETEQKFFIEFGFGIQKFEVINKEEAELECLKKLIEIFKC